MLVSQKFPVVSKNNYPISKTRQLQSKISKSGIWM